MLAVVLLHVGVPQVSFQGLEFCLMTSHFESCKNQSEERMNQLRVTLKKMMEVPEKTTVIFGGDTNLRDTEVRLTRLTANTPTSG